MPVYSFNCVSPEHPASESRHFEIMVHHVPTKRIDNYPCNTCGGVAKRDLLADVSTVNGIGMTPISHSTTVGGAISKEIEFMAGRFKKNPDGSTDLNHRPFRDTGELNKFMDGKNELGNPVVKNDGTVLRKADGTVVRQGAKLFKYGPNSTPSRDGIARRPNVPSMWCDANSVRDGSGGAVISGAKHYRSPQRRAR